MKIFLTLCAAMLLFTPLSAHVIAAPPKEEPVPAPDVMPSFVEGNPDSFLYWLNSRIVYPEKAVKERIEGKVLASFIIEKNGELTGIEILESNYKPFSQEVIRVLEQSPKWMPGKVDGLPVRTRLSLPVAFSLPEGMTNDDLRKFRDWVAEQVVLEQHRINSKRDKKNGLKGTEGIEGEVTVGFAVEPNGSIKNVEIFNSTNDYLAGEIARVLKKSSKLTLGYKDRLPVRTPLTMSIEFISPEKQKIEGVEVMPKFMGGDGDTFNLWVNRNVIFPYDLAKKMNIWEEKVIAGFVIDEAGRVTDITILNKCNSIFSDEVVNLLKKSPKWTPGYKDGKPVKVRLSIPIIFKFVDPADKYK